MDQVYVTVPLSVLDLEFVEGALVERGLTDFEEFARQALVEAAQR